ncbi:hypothetical protein [uncultured Photobacterium sp.]|uniref:hypothetical protein n=1 Tax=uncultured Photobacterium sp. TaxID=173973 RepID=UPI002604724E|nr:hypothetical protein [uncultured Photobacterium sp.]
MNNKLFRQPANTSPLLFMASALALLLATSDNASNSYSSSISLETPFPLKTAEKITGLIDFGTKFKKVEKICAKPEFDSSHSWSVTLNAFDQDNSGEVNINIKRVNRRAFVPRRFITKCILIDLSTVLSNRYSKLLNIHSRKSFYVLCRYIGEL